MLNTKPYQVYNIKQKLPVKHYIFPKVSSISKNIARTNKYVYKMTKLWLFQETMAGNISRQKKINETIIQALFPMFWPDFTTSWTRKIISYFISVLGIINFTIVWGWMFRFLKRCYTYAEEGKHANTLARRGLVK